MTTCGSTVDAARSLNEACQESRFSGCRPRHADAAGDQGAAQGNAAGGRQADHPVCVEEAAAAGCEEFIFVTGRGKTIIEDHFDRAVELFEALAAKARKSSSRTAAEVPGPAA
jgi:hypothetical protein